MMQLRSTWLISLALLTAVPVLSAQSPQRPMREPVITMSGHGEVRVTPDRGQISLSVQSRAASAAAAAIENATKQDSVIAGLRSLGIPNSKITTESYFVTPETRYDKETQAPHTVSYVVSNTVRVEITNLARLGNLIDVALERGANQVSSIEFSSSQSQAAYRLALVAAVTSAKLQAEAMAAAAAGRLGPLLEISNAGAEPQPQAGVMLRTMAMSAAPETPIMAGQQTVTAMVTMSWRFIPNL